MSIGKIVQVIGAVVDIEFPRDEMPKVYDALVLEKDENNKLAEEGLTFEVQQQLGDGVVRTIAMGSSEGLQRGMAVKALGHGIMVPVGPKTLGRIMLTVLPTPAPPNRPTLPPLANGQTRSITLMPVSSRSTDGLSSSNFGAARCG